MRQRAELKSSFAEIKEFVENLMKEQHPGCRYNVTGFVDSEGNIVLTAQRMGDNL